MPWPSGRRPKTVDRGSLLPVSAEEKRAGPRLEHPILVAYRSAERFLSDFGTNISRSGVFVNTKDPQPVGTRVRLLVSLPEHEAPTEIEGRVVRVVEPGGSEAPGMGIEFIDLPDATRARLDAMVRALKERLDAS